MYNWYRYNPYLTYRQFPFPYPAFSLQQTDIGGLFSPFNHSPLPQFLNTGQFPGGYTSYTGYNQVYPSFYSVPSNHLSPSLGYEAQIPPYVSPGHNSYGNMTYVPQNFQPLPPGTSQLYGTLSQIPYIPPISPGFNGYYGDAPYVPSQPIVVTPETFIHADLPPSTFEIQDKERLKNITRNIFKAAVDEYNQSVDEKDQLELDKLNEHLENYLDSHAVKSAYFDFYNNELKNGKIDPLYYLDKLKAHDQWIKDVEIITENVPVSKKEVVDKDLLLINELSPLLLNLIRGRIQWQKAQPAILDLADSIEIISKSLTKLWEALSYPDSFVIGMLEGIVSLPKDTVQALGMLFNLKEITNLGELITAIGNQDEFRKIILELMREISKKPSRELASVLGKLAIQLYISKKLNLKGPKTATDIKKVRNFEKMQNLLEHGTIQQKQGSLYQYNVVMKELQQGGRGVRLVEDNIPPLGKTKRKVAAADIITENGDIVQCKSYSNLNILEYVILGSRTKRSQPIYDVLRYHKNQWKDGNGNEISGLFEYRIDGQQLLKGQKEYTKNEIIEKVAKWEKELNQVIPEFDKELNFGKKVTIKLTIDW